MNAKRFFLATAVVALGGCPGRDTAGTAVEICTEIGPVERLTVSVFDTYGALAVEQPFPEGGGPPTLPGRLRISAEARERPVTILATGWREEQPVGFAAAELRLPGSARLCLKPFPPDRDGDLIPDDLDGCPEIPDPGQEDRDGDGVTDICAYLHVDAGGGAPPDGGLDARPGDLPAGVDQGLPLADGPRPPDLGPCPVSTACDDGDPCTTGDTCQAGGVCRGTTAPNGTSCGPLPCKRCCGGKCVNIAFDPEHCGGCGLRCAPGRNCSSVALTTECSPRPDQTSGRCICGYGDDAQCPGGQICREVDPARNRCSPKDKAHCASGQSVKWVTDCPNYCFY